MVEKLLQLSTNQYICNHHKEQLRLIIFSYAFFFWGIGALFWLAF